MNYDEIRRKSVRFICDVLCRIFFSLQIYLDFSRFPSQRSSACLRYLMALQNNLLRAVILHKPRDQDGGNSKRTSEESLETLQRQVLEYATHIFTAAQQVRVVNESYYARVSTREYHVS